MPRTPASPTRSRRMTRTRDPLVAQTTSGRAQRTLLGPPTAAAPSEQHTPATDSPLGFGGLFKGPLTLPERRPSSGGPGSPGGHLGAPHRWPAPAPGSRSPAAPSGGPGFPRDLNSSEDRNVAENRIFVRLRVVSYPAGRRCARSFPSRSSTSVLRPPGAQGGIWKPWNRQAIGEVEGQDSRGHLEPDGAVSRQCSEWT